MCASACGTPWPRSGSRALARPGSSDLLRGRLEECILQAAVHGREARHADSRPGQRDQDVGGGPFVAVVLGFDRAVHRFDVPDRCQRREDLDRRVLLVEDVDAKPASAGEACDHLTHRARGAHAAVVYYADHRAERCALPGMGKTIIISSHILPEPTELGTMLGIIDHGRMRATGTVREVIARLTSGRRLRINVLDEKDAAIEVLTPLAAIRHVEAVNGSIEAEYDGDERTASDILVALTGAGIRVSSFTPVDGGLEDAFLKATSEEVG